LKSLELLLLLLLLLHLQQQRIAWHVLGMVDTTSPTCRRSVFINTTAVTRSTHERLAD
jgi:hypothetical protein